jgi:hypothetical protein
MERQKFLAFGIVLAISVGTVSTEAMAVQVSEASSLSAQNTEDVLRRFSASLKAEDFAQVLEGIKRPFYTSYPPTNAGVVNLSKTAPSAETIKLWLEMYAALDSVEYQLSKRIKTVYTHVSPPEAAGLYSGDPAPSEIHDPVLRKEYEARIAENEKNRLVMINASAIRNQRMAASSFFWLWANGMYIDNPGAQASIETEARSLGCSPERVQWIKTIVSRKGFAPAEPIPSGK